MGKKNGELGESFGKAVSAVLCFTFGMVIGRMLNAGGAWICAYLCFFLLLMSSYYCMRTSVNLPVCRYTVYDSHYVVDESAI